jgi:hypothetical protein
MSILPFFCIAVERYDVSQTKHKKIKSRKKERKRDIGQNPVNRGGPFPILFFLIGYWNLSVLIISPTKRIISHI